MRLAQCRPDSRVAGLDTTALVHEGFLRMADQQGLQGESRGQFFAHVGQVLRSVVIDHLRSTGREKRGGDAVMVTLCAAGDVAAVQSQAVDLIGPDQALQRLRAIDVGLYELIEMVGFAGLSIAEVATLRGLSTRTINRELLKARTLLQELLGEGGMARCGGPNGPTAFTRARPPSSCCVATWPAPDWPSASRASARCWAG